MSRRGERASVGAKPFVRANYIRKFDAHGRSIAPEEAKRFCDLVQRRPQTDAEEVGALNVALPRTT